MAGYDVTRVEVLRHYMLHITFRDGTSGHAYLPWLEKWEGVFTDLHSPDFFAQARIDPETKTVTWPNGADIAPELLYNLAAGNAVIIR
jgi:hypothetical protein